jgi:hypothetical protein
MIFFLISLLFLPLCGQSPEAFQKKIDKAFKSGRLAWQFSDPSEVIKLFGEPTAKKNERDGGFEHLIFEYGNNIVFEFSRFVERGRDAHAGLTSYKIDETVKYPDTPLKPRNTEDLNRVNSWEGLANMDVSGLDLKGSKDLIEKLDFNTNTKWPSKRKLPKDFDPAEILEKAKNPGLGIRKLHEQGLNGAGIGIAIIDQPSLPNHIEYKENIKMYVELKPDTMPQMHGPFVTSIAAGKSLGVAPNANIYYFSMPMWEPTNSYYIQAIKRVVELNKEAFANIRAISISNGMFENHSEFDGFQNAVALAESNGIVVLTCAGVLPGIPTASLFNIGIIRPLSIHSLEDPSGYARLPWSETDALLVPGVVRTYASNLGDNIFTYSLSPGFSHVPPWLAGLIAIGFQANPNLTPKDVKNFLLDSAHKMHYGTVVNPAGFIELCKVK